MYIKTQNKEWSIFLYSVQRYVCNFPDINISVNYVRLYHTKVVENKNYTVPDFILVLGMYITNIRY